jgi:PmbA protein
MVKETVCIKEKKLSLSVVNNKVTAVLKSDTTKTGIRIYDNNCLGIAGAIGKYDENELTSRAKHMLKFKLPYECEPTSALVRGEDLSSKFTMDEASFVEQSKKLLEALSQKFPKFAFHHKIDLIETEDFIKNDVGLDLVQKDRYVDIYLTYKHKDSNSLMDGGGAYEARNFNFDDAFYALSNSCSPYEEKIDFSEQNEQTPVIFMQHYPVLMKFFMDLRGDIFGSGASLFSGKLNQKLFGDNFSLISDRRAEKTFTRFFDGEGVTKENDIFHFIKNGTLESPYTSKRMAKQFNLPISGSAYLQYDTAPDAVNIGMKVADAGKTIKELLGGKRGILVQMTSGGDFTPQGEYAAPIQVAYMFDGEKLLGRLPQLSMSSHINDMFGKDFIGASTDGLYKDSPTNFLAINMNVRKIDGWM